jgi:hypothetical protein
MNVLSIGNSFSQDAQRYFSAVARKGGKGVRSLNLYIGGCSLATHHRLMLSEAKQYLLECNGVSTSLYVSSAEALLADAHDIVTIQQASHFSYNYGTYAPYLPALAEWIRKCCPGAKLYLHQTWGYESGSDRLRATPFETNAAMMEQVRESYRRAAEEIDADGIIPSGEAMLHLAQSGVRAHRDGFHASLAAGRYAIALTWAGALLGLDPRENTFSDFDVPATEAEILAAKEAAAFALGL